MIEGLSLQPMERGDLAFAAERTAAEGWVNETYGEFAGLYAHDPQGCFIARIGDQPVGMCFATAYIASGFIGELIVIPEMRQRGIGAALLNHAVSYLHRRGCRTVYLDGVDAAVSLYERNGFRQICRSLRLFGHIPRRSHPQVRVMAESDLAEVSRLDQQAFGDDRIFFLEQRWQRFPELCKVMVDQDSINGYIMGRRAERLISAGPWVMSAPVSDPLPLLESLANEAGDTTIAIGILESNSLAVQLARSMGMEERGEGVWRMALGPDDDLGRSSQCLAIGTAGKG